MNRLFGMVAGVLFGLVASGCGGSPEPKEAASPASGAAQGEVCPTVSAGPPATCPEGCAWNGTECRSNRPIVIFDRPAPTSTATSTSTIVAPVQPAPSTP